MDEQTQSPVQTPGNRRILRPIGIKELLILTTLIAVAVGVQQFIVYLQESYSESIGSQAAMATNTILTAIELGVAVSGLIFLLLNWGRNGNGCVPLFRAPGHWMLVMFGVTGPLSTLNRAFVMYVILNDDGAMAFDRWMTLANVFSGAIGLIGVAIAVVGAILCWKYSPWPWLAVFAMLAFRNLMWIALIAASNLVASSISPVAYYVVHVVMESAIFLVLGFAIFLSFRRRVRYDWIHWLGVFLFVAGIIFSVIGTLVVIIHIP